MNFLQQTSSLGLRTFRLNIHSIRPTILPKIIPTLYLRSQPIQQPCTKLLQTHFYSTKTAPPPPPPPSTPHDKTSRVKGFLIEFPELSHFHCRHYL